MKNELVIIGISGVPANYGGFETLVDNLIESEAISFIVYCSSKNYNKKLETYKNAKLVYLPIKANGPQSVVYDIYSILHALFKGHRLFLILGVSGAIIIPIVSFFFPSSKFITNIDGIEWKRDKWSKFASYFLKISEKIAVKFSSEVIGDNDVICDYIKKTYEKNSWNIPYGGDHAYVLDNTKKSSLSALHDYEDYSLSICRIEPENNIHIVLEAFSNVDENIIFVGNWKNSKYGQTLYDKYKSFPNILLLNPIYDFDQLYDLRINCKAYVHGHSAGGTNPSLVEIMHFSKNIFAYDCNFNRSTLESNGRYFNNAISLKNILAQQKNFKEVPEIKEIAERRYTWKIIKSRYIELFNKVNETD